MIFSKYYKKRIRNQNTNSCCTYGSLEFYSCKNIGCQLGKRKRTSYQKKLLFYRKPIFYNCTSDLDSSNQYTKQNQPCLTLSKETISIEL